MSAYHTCHTIYSLWRRITRQSIWSAVFLTIQLVIWPSPGLSIYSRTYHGNHQSTGIYYQGSQIHHMIKGSTQNYNLVSESGWRWILSTVCNNASILLYFSKSSLTFWSASGVCQPKCSSNLLRKSSYSGCSLINSA